MSRSGYMDDVDRWDLIRWRGQVASAMRGKRGQSFLLEMWKAMDALSEKKLIADKLQDDYDGSVCAIGAIGKARGVDMSNIDPEDYEVIAKAFGVRYQLAQEIMYMNDERFGHATPEERFAKMKRWIESNLLPIVNEGESVAVSHVRE